MRLPDELVSAAGLVDDHPDSVRQLRRLVIALAIAGRLTERRECDEASDELLRQLDARHQKLVLDGKLTQAPLLREIAEADLPDVCPAGPLYIRLGDVAWIEKGRTGIASAKPGQYPLVVTARDRARCDHFDFDVAAAIIPLVSSAGHGKASIQRLHYQEGKFALGTILAAVVPHAPDLLSARFVFEYLTSFKDELLVSQMIGTANVTLTIAKVANVPIPLIAPEVQRRVDELMAMCDRLEAARADREAARDRLAAASLARLSALDPETFADDARFALDALPALTARADQIGQLRQTILNLAVRGQLVEQRPTDEAAARLLQRIAIKKVERKQATGDARIKVELDPDAADLPMSLPIGWAIQSFENLFLFIDYRGNTPPKTTDGIPLITAKNVRMGHLNRDPREFISAATFKTWMTRGSPAIGDLFFTTEAPLANVCVNDITEPFALAQRVICLQPYGEIDTRFVMMALMSDLMQTLIDGQATGLTAKGIKAAKLKPLPIPIPPLAEQGRIVARVNELMSLCDQLEASLNTAIEHRSRLLEAVLHGALESVDRVDEVVASEVPTAA
jgi:type I restriction enzyme S subunit